ncbi:MAG: DEAD/DEAH box helicase [Treponema sp.]|jgi:ATP-dependent RNA helicase DeaD|nr:DEAD/DEAH box helicase [Treponema sp.]
MTNNTESDVSTGVVSAFSVFGLSQDVLSCLEKKGFSAPTPIQSIALPRLMADEGHLIVRARTGTGKTAAFGIPLVEKLTTAGHAPRALILTPTRELCLQVSREIASLNPRPSPRITAVYGGASIRTQILDLKRGVEIVVGTPGRIMDLMERKVLDLGAVDWFILDEADEMLDMGFFEDVEKILEAVKPERRVALFSATMPEPILRVVRTHIGEVDVLEDPAPAEDEKPAVDQYYLVLKREDKLEALKRIIDQAEDFYGLVFCATKVETDELARRLVESGYTAEAIHGDLSQEARERTLRRFRARHTKILVATDVAARGLDIERLEYVINWNLPNDRETYVHRIGRTGRAGRRGKAVSLALPAERGRMKALSHSMERVLGSAIVWTQVPSVKSVMKALRRRIVGEVMEAAGPLDKPDPGNETTPGEVAAPDAENALIQDTPPAAPAEEALSLSLNPYIRKVCTQLVEELGAERALEALITAHYGEHLDPSRYGTVTEFTEEDFRQSFQKPGRRGKGFESRRFEGRRREGAFEEESRVPRGGGEGRRREGRFEEGAHSPQDGKTRVYVGLGRGHGAGAREVVSLLIRAGGVPGRLVDSIEMKEFCAFATLPAEAARRACAFSRNSPGLPSIRVATDKPPR